jgi:hypothetical protein
VSRAAGTAKKVFFGIPAYRMPVRDTLPRIKNVPKYLQGVNEIPEEKWG